MVKLQIQNEYFGTLKKTGTAIFNFYKTHEGAEHRNPNGVFLIALNYQPIIQ